MTADGLDNLLDATGKVLKIAPDVYKDGLQPSVKESGKSLSLIPRAINAALAPLQKWIIYKEYSIKETEALLEEKLKNISAEKIVTPEAYVAVPTLQAISYCMDCYELRDMFANLLAKSMNVDTKNLVHPSFSEIIKQLSPLDANIIKLFEFKTTYPLVQYWAYTDSDSGGINVETNIFLDYPAANNLQQIASSISNLDRLGIIQASYDASFTDKTVYSKFYKTTLFNNYTQLLGKPGTSFTGYNKIDITEGLAKLTPLGKNFIATCVKSF